MNKPKWILLASILSYSPAYSAENAFEYSAVTLSYARELSTSYQQEPQHLSADLSIEIAAQGFIYAGIQSGWVQCTQQSNDQSAESDITAHNIQLGYGAHHSLSQRIDIYGRLGLLLSRTDREVITRTSTSINSNNNRASATGVGSEIGLRTFVNAAQSIELTPSLQFTHLDAHNQTTLGIALSYHVNDAMQIQTGYDYNLDTKTNIVSLDFRIYGKSF